MPIDFVHRALSGTSEISSQDKVRTRQSLIGMGIAVGLLHIFGWFTLTAVAIPQHLSIGSKVFGLGVGMAAYVLGMRHAFDADHIAAIDNTTRKLMQDGQRPLSVGFWFSLGHSSVVFGLTVFLACGLKAVAGSVLDDNSALHKVTGLIGAVISSGFLYIIAALNMIVFADIWRLCRQARAGQNEARALEGRLANRGFMSRLLRPVMDLVGKPWQMFFVGLLFGLGFDTATEIALLVLTSSGAASGLPWYAVLCLPILFAAGMSLLDTIDGSFMAIAYGWALARPMRKIYYNLIVTGLSVAAALIIGTLEIIALLGEKLKLRGLFWNWIANIDFNEAGFFVVSFFVATWIVALALWKYGGAERKEGTIVRSKI